MNNGGNKTKKKQTRIGEKNQKGKIGGIQHNYSENIKQNKLLNYLLSKFCFVYI